MPSLFSCCKLSHNDGKTSIRIKSSCFDKPIIINISGSVDEHEVVEIIKCIKNKEKISDV